MLSEENLTASKRNFVIVIGETGRSLLKRFAGKAGPWLRYVFIFKCINLTDCGTIPFLTKTVITSTTMLT